MRFLTRAWAAWKAFGRTIGNVVGRVVLTVFHFTIFAPFALSVRWFSDPLDVKRRDRSSCWLDRAAGEAGLSEARRLT